MSNFGDSTARQLWRYDANQEGVLTGTFFATEQDIADVSGLVFDHPEFGMLVIELGDFDLVASDNIGDDDTHFIDAMIARNAVAGFDPILWMSAHAIHDDEDWTPLNDSDYDEPRWGLPDDDEDDFDDDDEDD